MAIVVVGHGAGVAHDGEAIISPESQVRNRKAGGGTAEITVCRSLGAHCSLRKRRLP